MRREAYSGGDDPLGPAGTGLPARAQVGRPHETCADQGAKDAARGMLGRPVAVALGWALGNPLPFVVALIIAGVDVIETSFLLLVVERERS